jgi:hypothetical protein
MPGAWLSWLDVFHEGPMADLPLEELSPVRARAIADRIEARQAWKSLLCYPQYKESMR